MSKAMQSARNVLVHAEFVKLSDEVRTVFVAVTTAPALLNPGHAKRAITTPIKERVRLK